MDITTDESIERARHFFKPKDENIQKDHGDLRRFNFPAYLARFNVPYKQKENGSIVRFVIPCPFNPDHGDDAAVWQRPDGKLAFHCFHDGCADKHWNDFRVVVSGSDSLIEFYEGNNQSISFADSAVVFDEDMPDPIPFDSFSSLPDFPVEELPEGIGKEMIIKVSEVIQIDPGFTSSCYLGVLSTAALGKYSVYMETHSEHENGFFIGILGSGERKSAVIAAMTKPLYYYQEELQKSMKPIIVEAENRQKIREARLKDLQKKAANEPDEVERKYLTAEADSIAKEIEENPVPSNPVIIVDEITTEKLGVMMALNGERMAVISAEGGIFDILGGCYSNNDKGNIELYLKGHAHDVYSCFRISRAPVIMKDPSLTLCLGVQPSVIEELGKNKRFRGKGLLARCLFAHCKPHAGYRILQDKGVPDNITAAYGEFIIQLAQIKMTNAVFHLSSEARELWKSFYAEVEGELKPDGSLFYITDLGSKLAGGAVRIAGLLHFAQHGKAAADREISEEVMRGAVCIGDYYKEHAIAVFGLMSEPPEVKSAKIILDAIRRNNIEKFKARMLFNHTNLKTMADIEPALKLLYERSYIAPVEPVKTHKPGRPEGKEYRVNPRVKEM